MHEIKVMAPLHHPNLVKLYGGCWDRPDELCIVLEFCPHGSLRDLLAMKELTMVDGSKLSELTWTSAYFRIMLSVAECFRYLHHEQLDGNPMIHRDLKPDNVLIAEHDGRPVPKVADFGESRTMSLAEAHAERKDHLANEEEEEDAEAGDFLTMTMVGTPMYVAEEVLRGEAYGTKVDVYSFGVVLFEGVCVSHGKMHFFVKREYKKNGQRAVLNGWRPRCPPGITKHAPELAQLVNDCWGRKPKDRPDFRAVVERLKAIGPKDWRPAHTPAFDLGKTMRGAGKSFHQSTKAALVRSTKH